MSNLGTMKNFIFILILLGIAPAISLVTPEIRSLASNNSRLVVYVQTFKQNNKPVSLLPLLDEKTGVTHVILASLHINDGPGNIVLNDAPLNSTYFGDLWDEVKTLQQNGIKVMGLLGGAAQGSYQRLSGSDDDVSG
jgi:hypothetical protein